MTDQVREKLTQNFKLHKNGEIEENKFCETQHQISIWVIAASSIICLMRRWPMFVPCAGGPCLSHVQVATTYDYKPQRTKRQSWSDVTAIAAFLSQVKITTSFRDKSGLRIRNKETNFSQATKILIDEKHLTWVKVHPFTTFGWGGRLKRSKWYIPPSGEYWRKSMTSGSSTSSRSSPRSFFTSDFSFGSSAKVEISEVVASNERCSQTLGINAEIFERSPWTTDFASVSSFSTTSSPLLWDVRLAALCNVSRY